MLLPFLAAVPLIPIVFGSAIVGHDDENQLRELQQRLARAWIECDRRAVEELLAPEWTVVTPDGRVVSRSSALDQAFASAVIIKGITTDDVSVSLYGSAAVVRGRTIASADIQGAVMEIRTRFTDTCIKRGDRWIVVASHQTGLPKE
jgi:ketosteroid isomerase-like protein